MFLAPLSNLLAYQFIERTSVNHLILKFPAGWVRGLNKNKKTFILFLTYINKWFYAICAKVWIHCGKIFVKSCIFLGTYLHMSQMAYRIGCRCRADIASFNVADHYQIFFPAVIYGSLICHKSRNAKLFIHCDLRFYCRDQIMDSVYDSLIKLPDCFCRALQSFAKFCKCLFLNLAWNVVHHWIQSYYDRCVCFFDLIYKFIDHKNFLLKLFLQIYLILSYTICVMK